jgi:hypothetical protein
MWCVWGTGEVHKGFWWGDLREGDHLEYKCRWKDNIEMDLQEVRWGSMDWTDLAVDRNRWQALVNTVMNLWVP